MRVSVPVAQAEPSSFTFVLTIRFPCTLMAPYLLRRELSRLHYRLQRVGIKSSFGVLSPWTSADAVELPDG